MDAAGKDGTIRHVMSGVNPQGVQVSSFKVPSSEDLDHDYLWRYAKKLPERGNIGIFNRSYYEEVLVVRVHPQILANQKMPPKLEGPRHLGAPLPRDQRLGALPDRPGLPVRQDVPQRLARRSSGGASCRASTSPRRTGSSARNDAKERAYWDDYQKAFCEVLTNTSTRVGAVVRRSRRRQAIRAGGGGRHPGKRPDRDRPALPEGVSRRPQAQLQQAKEALEEQAPPGVARDPIEAELKEKAERKRGGKGKHKKGKKS